jgi:hypothetical protein
LQIYGLVANVANELDRSCHYAPRQHALKGCVRYYSVPNEPFQAQSAHKTALSIFYLPAVTALDKTHPLGKQIPGEQIRTGRNRT